MLPKRISTKARPCTGTGFDGTAQSSDLSNSFGGRSRSAPAGLSDGSAGAGPLSVQISKAMGDQNERSRAQLTGVG